MKIHRRQNGELDEKDGISLLSTKNYIMMSYIHAVNLLSAQRVLGHSLDARSLPSQPFSDRNRDARGQEAGDLVDSLSEGRVILDKVKALEIRMRYQIEKLLRLAEGPETGDKAAEGVRLALVYVSETNRLLQILFPSAPIPQTWSMPSWSQRTTPEVAAKTIATASTDHQRSLPCLTPKLRPRTRNAAKNCQQR